MQQAAAKSIVNINKISTSEKQSYLVVRPKGLLFKRGSEAGPKGYDEVAALAGYS